MISKLWRKIRHNFEICYSLWRIRHNPSQNFLYCDGLWRVRHNPCTQFFFLLVSLCCAIKWTTRYSSSIPQPYPDFTQPLLLSTYPAAGDPKPPHNPSLHPPHKRTTGEDPFFWPAKQIWDQIENGSSGSKSLSCVQRFRQWDPVTGRRAGRRVRVVGEHRRAAKETGAVREQVIVAIFANCSLVFGWIECGLVKITLILQIQMYVLWHLLAYGSFV